MFSFLRVKTIAHTVERYISYDEISQIIKDSKKNLNPNDVINDLCGFEKKELDVISKQIGGIREFIKFRITDPAYYGIDLEQ